MSGNPIAFMSYVRLDDQHENGRLSDFRERLGGEVRIQTGDAFEIFQDRNDIAWGQQWKQRIEDALDAVTFLVPVITPAFFKSPSCRMELERFLHREQMLGRNDLVLPVYYIDCPVLSSESLREQDLLVKTLAARQYADWRELRFEVFSSPEVGKRIASIARQIVAALEQGEPGLKHPLARASVSRYPKPDRTQESDNESERTPGPEPKTEIPTLTVDALHRGNFSTLNEALEAAQPGTRILVRPGLYQEGIVVEKPVEIIGDGEKEDIVFEAFGRDVILFKSSMGRIANLTLRQTGGGKWYGVDISQGRLDLEDCHISSQSLAVIAIHGGADPRLRRNRLSEGKSSGVLIYESGKGTLEDNEIFGNAIAGVAIKEGANPTLRRNRIHNSKQSGVYIYDDAQGLLEDNEIFENELAGLEIKERASPTLRRNRIYSGKQGGIFIHKDAQGLLEDNEVFENGRAGVEIKEGANPTLRGNRIFNGKQSGIYIHHDAQGILENNEVFENRGAGVEIKEGANPTLRRNRIYNGKQSGVFIHSNGRGILEDNEILGNKRAGVAIQGGGNPCLRRNRISENGYEGIWVKKDGAGTFEDNDLRGNARGAWDIEAGSEENIKRKENLE